MEPDRHILYGEWVYAKHAIKYDHLPDLFIAFDLFDKYSEKFYSRDKPEELLKDTEISVAPIIDHKVFSSAEELKKLVSTPSQYFEGEVEGVIIRKTDGDWLENRGKIVRQILWAATKTGLEVKLKQMGLTYKIKLE